MLNVYEKKAISVLQAVQNRKNGSSLDTSYPVPEMSEREFVFLTIAAPIADGLERVGDIDLIMVDQFPEHLFEFGPLFGEPRIEFAEATKTSGNSIHIRSIYSDDNAYSYSAFTFAGEKYVLRHSYQDM